MPTQIDRLLQLLDEQDARVRAAFLAFVNSVRSDALTAQLVDLLENHDVDGALKIVDTYVARFANVIPEIMHTVGVATAVELTDALPDIAYAIGFDPTNPRAAALAASSRMELIRQLTDQQRTAVQQAISRSVARGAGTQEIGRAFRDSIGLTANQEAYVDSYRRLLEQSDRRALDRALRDRRFDDRVATAAERNRPLTDNQINVMVERYRARAVMARTETIGRTEALTAYSQAREEALQQMVDQTGLDQSRVRRVWYSTHDERVRMWHETMQGQSQPIGVPFTDGLGNAVRYPGDPLSPPETRINCRCTLGYEVAPPS